MHAQSILSDTPPSWCRRVKFYVCMDVLSVSARTWVEVHLRVDHQQSSARTSLLRPILL
jgi:hypothetical protein